MSPSSPDSGESDSLARFGWRLIGGNNRELARSAHAYLTYVDACDGVQAVRDCIAELNWSVNNEVHTGKWYWRADLDGTSLLLGGRSYERERDCRESIQNIRVSAESTAHGE